MREKDKDMSQERIVYLGNVGEANSASAIHVYNRSDLLKDLGYEIHAICDLPKNKERMQSNDIIKYHYLNPIEGKGKIRGLKWNVNLMFANNSYPCAKKLLKAIKPKYVILYEVDSVALQNKLRKYCNKEGITLIIETTEWMEISRERKVSANLIVSQKDFQKKYTDRKCKNVIAISSFLENHYKEQGCNVICIPPTFPQFMEKNQIQRIKDERCNASIRLVFAGSLSHKDYLKELIEALLVINKDIIKISFDIIGPSEEEIMQYVNEYNLTKYGIFVHGRKTHNEVLKIVQKADFSILLRQNKRYAKAGVSTKFCEAMKLGVPSICTQVGGTDLFVQHMQNGILVKDNTVDTLIAMLQSLLEMNTNEILEIKQNAYKYAEEKFSKKKYIGAMSKFLSESK